MIRVPLTSPIKLAARTISAVELRVPSRRVVEAMSAVRLPAGFTDAQVIRFAARLSAANHNEATLRGLDPADLAAMRLQLDALYAAGRRRFALSRKIAAEAKADREAGLG